MAGTPQQGERGSRSAGEHSGRGLVLRREHGLDDLASGLGVVGAPRLDGPRLAVAFTLPDLGRLPLAADISGAARLLDLTACVSRLCRAERDGSEQGAAEREGDEVRCDRAVHDRYSSYSQYQRHC